MVLIFNITVNVCVLDLEQVLTLEPNNKHAKTELGELNKASLTNVEPKNNIPHQIVVSEPPNQQTDKRHVHVVKRPVHLRSKVTFLSNCLL